MKHNNVIPNGHFHKQWQKRVMTWFDQPGQKKSRRISRAKKVAAAHPAPVGFLRPAVHCPTLKYNRKVRAGRGFSLAELKKAGISTKIARKLGVSVDHRRRNKSVEGLDANEKRLNAYKSKLIIVSGPSVKGIKRGSIEGAKIATSHFPVASNPKIEKSTKLTKEMIDFEAYTTLRKAQGVARYHGIRAKRAAEAAEKTK
jgi:large subunit ribosomal protein L13e